MNSKICQDLGIEFPLFAFTHCRDVVAAVTNAGGFGVLGAAGHTAQSLEIELAWLDEQVDGKPYGVDLIVPTSMDDKAGNATPEEIEARIPPDTKPMLTVFLRKTASMRVAYGIKSPAWGLATICVNEGPTPCSTWPLHTPSSSSSMPWVYPQIS